MRKIIVLAGLLLFLAVPLFAADVELYWDAAAGATGYKLYSSIDLGATWSAPVDVGNVQTYTWLGVSDAVLTLFRVGAYNAQGEMIRTEAGAWYNGLWVLPALAKGLGVK
jgi:hypothetical protein